MGVTTSSNNSEDNFEPLETEYEANLEKNLHDETKTDSTIIESKSEGEESPDEIYCVILDDEPIFYLDDTDENDVRAVLKTYAKKICNRAKRHYTELNFYIDEGVEDGEMIVNITTLQKFLLFSYDNLYCSIRAKKLSKQ